MATISLHHVLASLQGCKLSDEGNQRMLTRAGINPGRLQQGDDRVHTDQVARLFRLVQQELNDEFMGFTARRCKFGSFAMMGELVKHTKTLGELLQKSTEFYQLLTDDISLQLNTDNNDAEFSLQLANPTLDSQYFLTEFLLVIWHRFPSWYIGEAIHIKETHFVHPTPAYHKELQIMFPSQLLFNQGKNRLIFDAQYLSKPLRRTDRELEIFLAQNPNDIMTIPGEDSTLEATIERMISKKKADPLHFPNTEQLAKQLDITSLTLYRRLQKEGTSYQRIKDNIRREKAIELLAEQHFSIDKISEIVGFSEPRSFTRAFRQWTGLAPRQYRTLYR